MVAIFRWRSRSLNIILKVDQLRTILAMFALNWLTGFRGGGEINIFPIGSYVKIMSADGGHLGWRSGSQDIILKVDHLRTIHAMVSEDKTFKHFFHRVLC